VIEREIEKGIALIVKIALAYIAMELIAHLF
jgi:hypothetical protein